MNLINTVPRVDPKDLENMINTSMNVSRKSLLQMFWRIHFALLSRSRLIRICWWFNIFLKPSRLNWSWMKNWLQPRPTAETSQRKNTEGMIDHHGSFVDFIEEEKIKEKQKNCQRIHHEKMFDLIDLGIMNEQILLIRRGAKIFFCSRLCFAGLS